MTLPLHEWHKRYQQQANWTKNIRNYLFTQIGINSSQSVLEVGSGTGAILNELDKDFNCMTFGIDIDGNSCGMAQRNTPAVSITNGDGNYLPYKSNSFSITICHFLLLWVKKPFQLISEMIRVTQPGGYVIALAEPDYGGRIDFPKSLSKIGTWQTEALINQGANPFMGRELRSLFANSGLDNIVIGVLGGQWTHDSLEEFQLEWGVILSDLSQNKEFITESEDLKSLDFSSRESHQRILYVPTFYAIGEVIS